MADIVDLRAPTVLPAPVTDPALARALTYPYKAPDHAYLYWRGRTWPLADAETLEGLEDSLARLIAERRLPSALARRLLEDHSDGIPGLAARRPVVACGSNRAPERLAQKYGERLRDAVIPVTRVRIQDHGVFYAATITRYGAIPATIAPLPGSHAQLHVTWLSPEQLAIMNETEDLGVVYALRPLAGGRATDHGLLHYHALDGLFAPEGRPIALAAVPQAVSGGLPIADEEAALRRLHEGWAEREPAARDFAAFLRRLVGDEAFRSAVIAWMHAHAAVKRMPGAS